MAHAWGPPPSSDLVLILAYSALPVLLAVYLPVAKYLGSPREVGLSTDGVSMVYPHRTDTIPWARVDPHTVAGVGNIGNMAAPISNPNFYPWIFNYRDLAGRRRNIKLLPLSVFRALLDYPAAPEWRLDPGLRRRFGA